MKIDNIYPTKSDLKNLLSGTFFSKNELDERKQTALKCGFKNWDQYLEFVVTSYLSFVDIPELVEDMSPMFTTEPIKGSFILAINKHVNKAHQKRIDAVNYRYIKLPEDVQKRCDKFDLKFHSLIFKTILSKIHQDDPNASEFVHGVCNDITGELESIDSGPSQETIMIRSTLEDFSMKNTNQALLKSRTYFYLNDNVHLLNQLHDILVREKFIDPHPNFVLVFENEYLRKGLLPVMWKGKMHELGYLLWRMNTKKEYIDGVSLGEMIERLFCFVQNKNSNNIRTSISRSSKKFHDEQYINRNLKRITMLLMELSLI